VIGGLLVGAQLADRVAPRAGASRTVALGFALVTAALVAGATTQPTSGYGFAAAWMAVLGAGLGFAMPSAMDAAIGALSPERSGVGSALLMAMRQVGGTIGVAVLGSVLAATYRGGLDADGIPAAARDSVAAGVRVAPPDLQAAVRAAFVDGVDAMLWVCAAVALVGVVLALRFLPRRARAADPLAGTAESPHAV
jgi:MFS family permease